MNVIIFSHLRFNSVTQRPQHISHELSNKHGYQVLFIEEPIEREESLPNHVHIHYKHKDLAIFTPYMKWSSWETMTPFYAKHLTHYLETLDGETLFWFYSPQYVHILNHFSPDLVVYDCMDELSSFLYAPAYLPRLERRLLSHADVVFTGGTSLYENKRMLHSNVYNFPSSVDSEHFKSARLRDGSIPADIANLSRPIAGFYGVLDERLNLELMAEVADYNRDISWVYIGPVVKINQSDLPIRPNIHYLGSKPYEKLPFYLRAFDVAVMPFAINKATTYISPTKTLEFMAAHLPIVSTPIKDVVRHFSQTVHIASQAKHFYLKVEQALQETLPEKKKRIAMQNRIIRKTSWSQTVSDMLSHINDSHLKSLDTLQTDYTIPL